MFYDPKGCIFDMFNYGLSHKKVFDCVGRPGHNDFLRNTSSIQSRSYKQSASILIYIYAVNSKHNPYKFEWFNVKITLNIRPL